MKAAKPDYKFMHVMFNQCVRANLGKIVGTAFLYSLIGFAFLCTVFLILSVFFGAVFEPENIEIENVDFPVHFALYFFILYVYSVFLDMLSYGMYEISARFILKKSVRITDLFAGFSTPECAVLKIALIFRTVIFVISLPIFFVAHFISEKLTENPDMLQSENIWWIGPAALLITVLMLAVWVYCIFIWLIYFSKKDISVRQTFEVSFKLMKGKVLHFIGFLIYCCGIDFAAVVVLDSMSLLLPQQGMSSGSAVTGSGIVTLLMSFCGVFFGYRAFSKFYVSVSVYFYSLIGILHKHVDVNLGDDDILINEVSVLHEKVNAENETAGAGESADVSDSDRIEESKSGTEQ